MATMIDPPSGWKYGFPKELPEDVEDIKQWLIDNGYPEKDIDENIKYCRMWGKPTVVHEYDELPPELGGRHAMMWKDISNKVFAKPEVIKMMDEMMEYYKSNWNLNRHIVGKVYDLTQENMNAMIADIEYLKSENIKIEKQLLDFQTRYNESLGETSKLTEVLEWYAWKCEPTLIQRSNNGTLVLVEDKEKALACRDEDKFIFGTKAREALKGKEE